MSEGLLQRETNLVIVVMNASDVRSETSSKWMALTESETNSHRL